MCIRDSVIMDVLECDSHKLIELKNTWDETLWNGRWSPFSNAWTRRLREIVAQHKAQKNNLNRERFGNLSRPLVKVPKGGGKCFYMCLEDFLQYFEVIFFNAFFDDTWEKHVIRDAWTVGRCGGSVINSETVRYNPQYFIKLMRTTATFFLLHQILPYSKFGMSGGERRATDSWVCDLHVQGKAHRRPRCPPVRARRQRNVLTRKEHFVGEGIGGRRVCAADNNILPEYMVKVHHDYMGKEGWCGIGA
eukprot:TRINITY_DN4101_c0_g3_i4.p1 TRINITY_DN4101_c0_g3~~TRINITY_DN4101_c0_g3_i4.p1  ORF type:complete len:263 (+),score=10.08 TRINITY_DN4101_c0_g3_i4:48-791(+)